jgi:hypothetical protein
LIDRDATGQRRVFVLNVVARTSADNAPTLGGQASFNSLSADLMIAASRWDPVTDIV